MHEEYVCTGSFDNQKTQKEALRECCRTEMLGRFLQLDAGRECLVDISNNERMIAGYAILYEESQM
jgi:hypothetical protein